VRSIRRRGCSPIHVAVEVDAAARSVEADLRVGTAEVLVTSGDEDRKGARVAPDGWMAATVLLPTHNWTTRRHTSNADNQPGSRPPFADPKKKGWTATGVGGDGGGAAWTGEVAAQGGRRCGRGGSSRRRRSQLYLKPPPLDPGGGRPPSPDRARDSPAEPVARRWRRPSSSLAAGAGRRRRPSLEEAGGTPPPAARHTEEAQAGDRPPPTCNRRSTACRTRRPSSSLPIRKKWRWRGKWVNGFYEGEGGSKYRPVWILRLLTNP
jgi:hypothetical protein